LRAIVWSEQALEHLEAIAACVSVYDPAAAARLAERQEEPAGS
jgi:plasmid stabilization system protein ParE